MHRPLNFLWFDHQHASTASAIYWGSKWLGWYLPSQDKSQGGQRHISQSGVKPATPACAPWTAQYLKTQYVTNTTRCAINAIQEKE
jgi:hypothetical protein